MVAMKELCGKPWEGLRGLSVLLVYSAQLEGSIMDSFEMDHCWHGWVSLDTGLCISSSRKPLTCEETVIVMNGY